MGWQVSAVGMGAWNLANQWGEIDEATAFKTIRSAVDAGVNLFDTAEGYGIPPGLSEQRLGRALAGDRHQHFVVSKVGSWGRRSGHIVPRTSVDLVRLSVHASLYRLRTDWIDVLLCHEGKIEDPSIYLEAFDQMKSEGLIRAYGISTNKLQVLKRFNVQRTCQVLEIDYSLLNRKPEAKILPYCQKHGIAVIARGPLAKGLLTGKYSRESVFTDSIRAKWHREEKYRQRLEHHLRQVGALQRAVGRGLEGNIAEDRDAQNVQAINHAGQQPSGAQELAATALRYVISHPVEPVAIPGAKSPAQARANAAAGERLLSVHQRSRCVDALRIPTLVAMPESRRAKGQ